MNVIRSIVFHDTKNRQKRSDDSGNEPADIADLPVPIDPGRLFGSGDGVDDLDRIRQHDEQKHADDEKTGRDEGVMGPEKHNQPAYERKAIGRRRGERERKVRACDTAQIKRVEIEKLSPDNDLIPPEGLIIRRKKGSSAKSAAIRPEIKISVPSVL